MLPRRLPRGMGLVTLHSLPPPPLCKHGATILCTPPHASLRPLHFAFSFTTAPALQQPACPGGGLDAAARALDSSAKMNIATRTYSASCHFYLACRSAFYITGGRVDAPALCATITARSTLTTLPQPARGGRLGYPHDFVGNGFRHGARMKIARQHHHYHLLP